MFHQVYRSSVTSKVSNTVQSRPRTWSSRHTYSSKVVLQQVRNFSSRSSKVVVLEDEAETKRKEIREMAE